MKQQKYRFFIVNSVVFDIPSNVYDEHAVKGWLKEVEKAGKDLDNWLILSIPDNSLAISSSAAKSLSQRLPELKRHGCRAILILASHTSAKIFHHSIKNDVEGFDIIVSESMEYLCQQSHAMLGEEGVLDIFHQNAAKQNS